MPNSPDAAWGMGARNLQRLLGCSIARIVWPLMDARSQRAVEAAERFAHGGASWQELMDAHEVANEVVRVWEERSWARELSVDEEARHHAAWAAWAATDQRPWKPVNSGLRAAVNVMQCQGKGSSEIDAVLSKALQDALAAPFSGS